MIEEKTYTAPELFAAIHTKTVKDSKDKLNRYNIKYSCSGRGSSAIFTIQSIPDKFRCFCVWELDITPQADFDILALLFYYYLNDDEFAALPQDEMSNRMTKMNQYASRPTINKWLQFLSSSHLISLGTEPTECAYYLSKVYNFERTLTPITVEQYNKAWREFWKRVNEDGADHVSAMKAIYREFGGRPIKIRKPVKNAIYAETINELSRLALEHIAANY